MRTIFLPAMTLATTLLSTALYAEQPSPGVREVMASEKTMIPLTTRIRFTSVIILPPSEVVTQVLIGDADNWVVNTTQTASNQVSVKPAKEGATTNLNLNTATGAVYSFLLMENAKAQTDYKITVVPDPAKAEQPQKFVPVSSINELVESIAALKADILTAQNHASQAAVEPKPAAFDPAAMQFPYTWDKKAKGELGVKEIWRDDRRTYIRADSDQVGAAVYEVTASGPVLVQFSLEDGLYTIPRVLAKGVLVKGRDRLEFSATAK